MPPREVLEGGRPHAAGGRRQRFAAYRFVLVAVVAAGVGGVIGGLVAHAWDGRRSPISAPAPAAESSDLRFSLAYQTGGLASPSGSKPVLSLTLVVSNDGALPATVSEIRVSRPGAAYVTSPAGGPPTDLPQAIGPNRSVRLRFGISSDCAVPIRPLPQVIFIVHDAAAGTHTVAADIPDLDALWGMTLLAPACGMV